MTKYIPRPRFTQADYNNYLDKHEMELTVAQKNKIVARREKDESTEKHRAVLLDTTEGGYGEAL